MTPSPITNRHKRRIKVRIPVTVRHSHNTNQIVEGEILDISEGGAFIECKLTLPVGETVGLEIHFHQIQHIDGKVVEWEAVGADDNAEVPPPISRIVWVKDLGQNGFGVEFTLLAPEKRQQIRRLIEYYDQLKKAGVSF